MQDYKLGLRMLVKYPGLTIAGGLALAIAIGIGAAGSTSSRQILAAHASRCPRATASSRSRCGTRARRRRAAHRCTTSSAGGATRARSTDLGAYRTVERNLVIGGARLEPVTAAEITASAFALARVPPLLGRPLLEADERPGAAPVVVLGYTVWQRQFGGRAGIVGQIHSDSGGTPTTVVGVMPEGFAFPVNHRLWMPLQCRRPATRRSTGPPIRVFARLAPGCTQAQAYAEVTTLTDARRDRARRRRTSTCGRACWPTAASRPATPRSLEFAVTHLPILLVLLVACVNVGTLVYARTATRDAEIAMRYALGASRGAHRLAAVRRGARPVGVAAAVGLTVAHFGLKWVTHAFNSGDTGGLPFWVDPGLKPTTILFAAALTMAAAAILGVLPALKATRSQVHTQLRNLGAGARRCDSARSGRRR